MAGTTASADTAGAAGAARSGVIRYWAAAKAEAQ
jgi:hypothetical protein